MTKVGWDITHSVETNPSPAFAWDFWTNVANWADPSATFELDGPFAGGSQGTTRILCFCRDAITDARYLYFTQKRVSQ